MPITTANLFSIQSIKDLVTDPLFDRSVVLDSGLVRLDTDATKVLLPTVTGGVAGWHTELQTLTDANLAASEVEVVPKKIATLQLVSNESLSDANAAEIIGRALVGALASGVDSQFFLGGDADGPDGIEEFYEDGLEVVDASAATDLDVYVDAIAQIEDNGGTPSVIWMRGATWAALSKLKQATGSEMPVLNPQPTGSTTRSIQGVAVRVSSSSLPTPPTWPTPARSSRCTGPTPRWRPTGRPPSPRTAPTSDALSASRGLSRLPAWSLGSGSWLPDPAPGRDPGVDLDDAPGS